MPLLFPHAHGGQGKSAAAYAFKALYPMHVVPVSTLLEMAELLPHDKLMAEKKLTKFTPELAGRIAGVSHQWLGHTAPDPEGVHLKTLQRVLRRLMRGEIKRIEDYWLHQVLFGTGGLQANWKAVQEMFIWIDYCSMPQIGPDADAEAKAAAVKSVHSIPAYMERCSLLFVVAPPCKHRDTGSMCNYATWRGRGWCRTELLACILAPQDIRVVVCTGVEAQPWMIHPFDGPRLIPGAGRFSCCDLQHSLNGMTLECDKAKVQAVLRTMVEAKTQLLARDGRRLEQQFWAGLRDQFTCGLPDSGAAACCTDPVLTGILDRQRALERKLRAGGSAAEALKVRLAWGDGKAAAAGKEDMTLLMCAALADDRAAVSELLASGEGGAPPADLEACLARDHRHLAYMWKGQTALGNAMIYGTPGTVGTLLDAGARPMNTGGGFDPLMGAACRGQRDNVAYWLGRFPGWNLERTDTSIGLTCSCVASVSGVRKAPILRHLLDSRAALGNRRAWGREGVLLALVATNEDSDMEALEELLRRGADPNVPWRAHTPKWRSLLGGVRLLARCSRSRVLMELALLDKATPLHCAAKRGDVSFVRRLLDAGATMQKNAAGHTPLDVARTFFGDHTPDILTAALSDKGGLMQPGAAPDDVAAAVGGGTRIHTSCGGPPGAL